MNTSLQNCTVLRELLSEAVPSKMNYSLANDHPRTIGDPGIYIITVLLFYSFGIVILMINYMTKNTNESEDYYLKYLEQFRRNQRENTSRNLPSRLALHALNAVNVIQTDEKVTYV